VNAVAIAVPDSAELKRVEKAIRLAAQAARSLDSARIGDVIGRHLIAPEDDEDDEAYETLVDFLETVLATSRGMTVEVLVIARDGGQRAEEVRDGSENGDEPPDGGG
jgi:hypothetical protein